MHVHFCVAGAACVGECVCIKVCLNRAGRLHGVLAGRIVTWWPRRGKKLAEKTVSLLPDWLMLPINSSINKNTKRKSALLSIWGICCLIRSMFIMKRKHTKNPTYLVYSPPSMTWQHRQGKSVQQIANNMLPGLAKETVSSRSPSPPQTSINTGNRDIFSGACWWGHAGFLPCFATHVSRGNGIFGPELDSCFHPEGLWDILIMKEIQTRLCIYSVFFKGEGEGWVKRAVIERGWKKILISALPPAASPSLLSSFCLFFLPSQALSPPAFSP